MVGTIEEAVEKADDLLDAKDDVQKAAAERQIKIAEELVKAVA
jgi:hypothetical protein